MICYDNLRLSERIRRIFFVGRDGRSFEIIDLFYATGRTVRADIAPCQGPS